MLRIVSSFFVMTMLLGCLTPASYFPYGGSRADGTVELICNYSTWEPCDRHPQQDPPTEEMNLKAAQVCQAWGYEGAQPFGSYIIQPGFDGSGQIRIPYQCIGDLEK